jgi:hypothetical protein
MIHEGGCLCGKVRYRLSVEPHLAGYCHCRMCQRNSGAPAVAWVVVREDGFSWGTGEPSTFRSSAGVARQFCGACGSYLVFRREGSNEVSVNTASLDDPAAYPPQMHIFAASRIPWFRTVDDLPAYDAHEPTAGS